MFGDTRVEMDSRSTVMFTMPLRFSMRRDMCLIVNVLSPIAPSFMVTAKVTDTKYLVITSYLVGVGLFT